MHISTCINTRSGPRARGQLANPQPQLDPRRALEESAAPYIKLDNYRPELILEYRLAEVLKTRAAGSGPPLTS